MIKLLIGVFVFVAACALDVASAKYTQAVQRGRAHAAGVYSVTMFVVSALGFYAVTASSLWYMVPEALGYYVGTRIALRSRLHDDAPMA